MPRVVQVKVVVVQRQVDTNDTIRVILIRTVLILRRQTVGAITHYFVWSGQVQIGVGGLVQNWSRWTENHPWIQLLRYSGFLSIFAPRYYGFLSIIFAFFFNTCAA